jgi:nitroreductase
MELQTAINNRKSIRSFEKKKVSKNVLKELIADAIKAPSAGNRQPWIFYVVESKKKRDKAASLLSKLIHVNSGILNKLPSNIRKVGQVFYSDLGGCPAIIFIYAKKDAKTRDTTIMSISAAIENLMLSAVDKGLGTCWVETFRGVEKELNKILKVPNDEEFIASIIVGYPKKGYVPLIRDKKPLKEVLKFL